MNPEDLVCHPSWAPLLASGHPTTPLGRQYQQHPAGSVGGAPSVSVITGTWQRNDLLLTRCVPSVQAQTWPKVEHIIVSDGPDEVLEAARWPAGVVFEALESHDPECFWGHRTKMRALELARGEFVAYLDDDDAYRPDHVALLAHALIDDPTAGFAYSRMAAHMPGPGLVRIGDGPLAHGRIGTQMIMHRRSVLDVETWRNISSCPEWDLVTRWLAAGVPYVSVDAVTVDYYPANPMDPRLAVPVAYRPWSSECVNA